jgi:hypothetical protein
LDSRVTGRGTDRCGARARFYGGLFANGSGDGSWALAARRSAGIDYVIAVPDATSTRSTSIGGTNRDRKRRGTVATTTAAAGNVGELLTDDGRLGLGRRPYDRDLGERHERLAHGWRLGLQRAGRAQRRRDDQRHAPADRHLGDDRDAAHAGGGSGIGTDPLAIWRQAAAVPGGALTTNIGPVRVTLSGTTNDLPRGERHLHRLDDDRLRHAPLPAHAMKRIERIAVRAVRGTRNRRVCDIRVAGVSYSYPFHDLVEFSDGLQDIIAETERLVPTNGLRPTDRTFMQLESLQVQDAVEYNRNLYSGREVRERRAEGQHIAAATGTWKSRSTARTPTFRSTRSPSSSRWCRT